jgi:hypothetical protein
MSNWSGFGDLDLAKIEADEGSRRLQVGNYKVKCTSAKVESIGESTNKRVVADFEDVDGTGDIRMNFNVFHSSEKAQEVGQRQLKSFLVASQHPNPDKPEDVSTLVSCKVSVGMGKPWKDNQGNERQQTEIKRFAPIDSAKSSGKDKKPSTPSELDDEIPF